MKLYHATTAEFDRFENQPKSDPGFHFGTLEQARMRGSKNARILEVELSISKPKRLKDAGSWTKDQITRAKRAGYDSIVYLNRYEGISTERIQDMDEKGMLSKLDSLSDAQFRKIVPESQDSYIVFDADQIRLLNVIEPDFEADQKGNEATNVIKISP